MSESYIDSLLTPRIAQVIKLATNKSRIVLEPLEPGFGHTLGNSLRRILLSAVPGSAVVEVKIEGVQHEYSIIDGVREDVMEVMLNLKQLAINMPGMKSSTARLNKTGPATVKASDIELSGDVEILNKDHVIAHLTEEGKIEMELTIEQGRGYRLASEAANEQESRPIGSLLLDASFCPVKSVVYSVEKTRVGQRIDLDKLLVDVEVNGTIEPRDAVQQAATILHAQLVAFVNLDQVRHVDPSGAKQELSPILDQSIRELEEHGLTSRSINALLNEKIMRVGELVQRSEQDLLKTPNIGMKSIVEIKQALQKCELELGMALENWPRGDDFRVSARSP